MVGGNQEANPARFATAGLGRRKGIAAVSIRAARVIRGIAYIDRAAYRRKGALGTGHAEAVLYRIVTQGEAVPSARVSPVDRLEADTPWHAVVVLTW